VLISKKLPEGWYSDTEARVKLGIMKKNMGRANSELFLQKDLTFKIIEILDKGKDLDNSLQQFCDAIARKLPLW